MKLIAIGMLLAPVLGAWIGWKTSTIPGCRTADTISGAGLGLIAYFVVMLLGYLFISLWRM